MMADDRLESQVDKYQLQLTPYGAGRVLVIVYDKEHDTGTGTGSIVIPRNLLAKIQPLMEQVTSELNRFAASEAEEARRNSRED